MKALLGIVLSALLVSGAIAQITVNQNHMPSAGTTVVSFETDADVSFSPGSGGNQTWNISGFNYIPWDVQMYISPVGTPYYDLFPNATLCQTYDNGLEFSYYRVASDGLYFLGFAVTTDSVPYVQDPDQDVLVVRFPCTNGTTWTGVLRMTVELMPGFATTNVDSAIYTVDGWGTLTTPAWSEAALRVTRHGYFTVYFNGTPIGDTTEDWQYQWLTQATGRGASFSNYDATGPNYTTGVVSYTNTGTVDAGPVRGPVAESFKLSQNYPNPFNPTTNLPIQLDKQTSIQLTVYNETGQVVYEYSVELGAGQHELPIDGSAWSSGSYFAKVMAGNEVQTARMVLVK